MTSTAVKNAQAVMVNIVQNAGKSAKGAAVSGGADFQSVWSNQMDKSGQNAVNVQKEQPGQKQPGEPVKDHGDAGQEKPKEAAEALKTPGDREQPAKADGTSRKQPENAGELSPEELDAAMEVLGAAAAELMQEVADIFGISMEELRAAMEELGLEPVDLLQTAGLGELVLKLGGAEDSLTLLTDEVLCGNYKAVMEQMTEVLGQTAEELGVEPEQLEALLNGRPGLAEPQEKVSEGDRAGMEISSEDTAGERTPVEKPFERIVSEGRVSETGVMEEKDFGAGEPKQQENAGKIPGTVADNRLQVQGAANETDAAQDKKGGEKQSGNEADGGQQGNLFAQEFKTFQPEAGIQQAQGTAQGAQWTADTQDIMRQIMDYMKLQLNEDMTNLEMQLHPASLGTIHIQVEAKGGVITANFIAQNEAVKAAIESQIVQLKENFAEQGVKVEAIEVMVQSHAFERNLDQGREHGQSGQEPSKRARVRRIDLNDMSTMEDMEEEDALAADMLAAGGSTVDYTA